MLTEALFNPTLNNDMMQDDDIIQVVTARKNGKKIQRRNALTIGSEWRDFDNAVIKWDFVEWEYRQAPEPMVIWALVNPAGELIDCRRSMSDIGSYNPDWEKSSLTLKKFVEVVE